MIVKEIRAVGAGHVVEDSVGDEDDLELDDMRDGEPAGSQDFTFFQRPQCFSFPNAQRF